MDNPGLSCNFNSSISTHLTSIYIINPLIAISCMSSCPICPIFNLKFDVFPINISQIQIEFCTYPEGWALPSSYGKEVHVPSEMFLVCFEVPCLFSR